MEKHLPTLILTPDWDGARGRAYLLKKFKRETKEQIAEVLAKTFCFVNGQSEWFQLRD